MNRPSSTIYALSSGALPAGVAVLRISGDRVRFVLETMCGFVPEPRVATLAGILSQSGEVLDRGLILFFPGPASFTGEDVAELHLHGSRAVVAAVLERLWGLPDLHPAEAGEFTRRAYLNGKLDLTAAEALADLIDAETEYQRKMAAQNASGAQRRLYEGWRSRIVHARAMIEAELDFSDEGDVPGSVSEKVWTDIRVLRSEMVAHRRGLRDGEIVRDGFKVALMGAPNSGKSSLLNALAGRDVAIVTEEAGTTRDIIEVALDLGGVKVRFVDTAGIREGAGTVERIGIARAVDAAAEADLVVVLDDLTSSDRVEIAASDVLRIGSKADLAPSLPDLLCISAVTGMGMEGLVEVISDKAKRRATQALESVVPTRLRHAHLLDEAESGLAEALVATVLELKAEGLRMAGEQVGRLTGHIHTEEILGAVFSRFCIGK